MSPIWDTYDYGGFGVQKRLLLVEDDARFREVFALTTAEALAKERLEVAFVEAGSLAEARARLREGGLDGALINATLPDGDGLALVREIHDGRSHPPVPTLVLAESLDPSVAVRALEAGTQGALWKVTAVAQTVEVVTRLTD